MEKTLVILKPCTVQRGLIGEIVNRFEKKGLRLAGMKMVWLTDEILSEHYAHLKEKPFFQRIKDAMSVCPVIVCCWEGVDAIHVVRTLAGATNGRNAAPGTIRGDYSMSVQENIVHASDSPETAEIELKRFFKDDEIFDYELKNLLSLYANDEFYTKMLEQPREMGEMTLKDFVPMSLRCQMRSNRKSGKCKEKQNIAGERFANHYPRRCKI